ncbi:MAG: ATP-binding cassette domain-containing protein [Pseudomonadota bacterium]
MGYPQEQHATLREISHQAITLVDGPNFSGRTDYMRAAIDADNGKSNGPSIYIGPEVYNSVSGLTTSVIDELRLHATENIAGTSVGELAAQLGLLDLSERNPFSLSGGEQAALVMASTLALNPRCIAIDCALEQMDRVLKSLLFAWLSNPENTDTMKLLFADNRMIESRDSIIGPRISLQRKSVNEPQRQANILPIEPLLPTLGDDFNLAPWKDSEPCEVNVDALSFSYGKGIPALNNISATFKPGGIYLLNGRNGAGKSTLAKVLSGVLKPNTGEIRSNEIPVQPWKTPGRLFSYHFQNPDLQLFSTTVFEELQSGLAWRPLAASKQEERVMQIAKMFGLTGLMNEHPLDLPFVLRKRVALAATLVMGTPWMILDEPTLGQDDQSAATIAALIKEMAAHGTGVIIISHSTWFADFFDATPMSLLHGKLTIE